MADVYAGDTSAIHPVEDGETRVYTFAIEADADPDVLSRIAGVCNLANVAPRRLLFERGPRGQATARVEMTGISAATADSILRKLLQLTSVTAVNML